MPKSIALVSIVVAGILAAVALPASAQPSPSSTRTQQIPIGAFILLKRRDLITDVEKKVLVTTPLDSGTSKPEAALTWSCVLNSVRVMYHHQIDELGEAEDQVAVQYRFGDNPASAPQRWDRSSSRVAVFLPFALADEFTREAQSSPEVVFRVTLLNVPQKTDVFSLEGLSEGLHSLPCYRP